jgi:hypothetical protein
MNLKKALTAAALKLTVPGTQRSSESCHSARESSNLPNTRSELLSTTVVVLSKSLVWCSASCASPPPPSAASATQHLPRASGTRSRSGLHALVGVSRPARQLGQRQQVQHRRRCKHRPSAHGAPDRVYSHVNSPYKAFNTGECAYSSFRCPAGHRNRVRKPYAASGLSSFLC